MIELSILNIFCIPLTQVKKYAIFLLCSELCFTVTIVGTTHPEEQNIYYLLHDFYSDKNN